MNAPATDSPAPFNPPRRAWISDGPAKGNILLVHGLGEHCGRFDHVGTFLADRGYSVHSFDLPAHGGCSGPIGDIEDVTVFLDAIGQELERLPTDLPRIIYAHSMGAMLAMAYVLQRAIHPDRLVLSSPFLTVNASPVQRAIAKPLSKVFPKLRMPAGVKGHQLSTDASVGEAYFADPLVNGMFTMRFGASILEVQSWVRDHALELSLPTYIFVGSDDQLATPPGTAAMGDLPNVTRRLWPGLRHETHNEPSWETVLGEVVNWLDAN